MPEQCCGTCQRWTCAGGDVGDCSLFGGQVYEWDGEACRAYLEEGRETVRVRAAVSFDGKLWSVWGSNIGETDWPSGSPTAWVEADIQLPDDPPTVEGFTE